MKVPYCLIILKLSASTDNIKKIIDFLFIKLLRFYFSAKNVVQSHVSTILFSFDTGEKYLKKQRKSFISALLTLIKKH